MPKKLREWLESVLLAIFVVVILFISFWPFSVSGNSMEPLFSDRDRITISRAMVWLGLYESGDIVVCKQIRGDKLDNVLKRIVGVPGDLIEIYSGDVYINGEILAESYLAQDYTAGDIELTLADDEYFVMGDNRESSSDSRNLGPVSSAEIVGRVVFRWFPFNKITFF